VAGRPIGGPIAILVLAIPGVVLAEALGGARRPWPERILSAAAAVIVVSILAGVGTAISPRGLDASALAAVELLVVAVAAVTWLWRRPRRKGRRRSPAGRRRLRSSVPMGGGSVAMVVLGMLLGAAGFAVATRAAQAQHV